jgi:hypothetical protein
MLPPHGPDSTRTAHDRFAGDRGPAHDRSHFDYLGNSPADDVPHWVADPSGPAVAILAMPYYYSFDDQFFLLFPTKGSGLEHADTLDRN